MAQSKYFPNLENGVDNADVEQVEQAFSDIETDVNNILNTKQDKLTFDSTPTAGSTNPVTSGGVKTALDGKAEQVELERLHYYGDKDIVPSDESYFTVNSTGETITGLTDAGKTQAELVIPYKINGKEITRIGDVFNGYTSLTSVTFPNSVTSIESYAFVNCISLTSINIPTGVISIGIETFSGCTSLTSINIPNSVTSIGNYAFSQCASLTSINIPNSITSIGYNAFDSCINLTIYCEQGSYAETYAKENNIPVIYTDIKATSINPTVKTTLEDTITVNTIYDLGMQTELNITLPSGQLGDFIEFDFISGETATNLTVNSSSGLVGFDLIPGTNTIYTLYFDWGVAGYDGTSITYGWRCNYSEYSINV